MLKCLELELGEKQEEAREKKLAKKYRMVKFFGKSVSHKISLPFIDHSLCVGQYDYPETIHGI